MGSTGVRKVVAVCGVVALAASCSSGSKHVTTSAPTTRASDDLPVTTSTVRASKRVSTTHANKRASTPATAKTSGSSTSPTTAGSNVSSNAGSAMAPAGGAVTATTYSPGNSSSEYVIGPIGNTTPTTVAGPKPYDPSKPIDLGGEPGVTPAEQARAEKLVRDTLRDLPKYANPATAYAAGYRSIGDGAFTADEHYINWAYLDDGHILDSKYPESLVYEMRNGKKVLAAAMYILPLGSRFSDAPDVGGALTQWHVHSNLCLVDNPSDPLQKVVSSLIGANDQCPPGSSKASVPMLHVWIVANPCGPFAALEGVGAGQVPDGQTRLCDTGHGSAS